MKLLLSTFSVIVLTTTSAQSNKLRLTLQSHNETSDPFSYTNSSNWNSVKTNLAKIVDTIEFYQARYNLQCESNFIRANISMDNAATLSTDLLQTMEEHALIEVDPHNHYDPLTGPPSGNVFNYADLAKLLDSCGITRIQTVGGFIYQSSEWSYPAYEDWSNYQNGIQGSYFPNETWTPQILWGGGTLNHVNDPFSLGVWRPGGATSSTFESTNSSNLLCLGNGCGWVIQNNTNIDSLVTAIENYTDYFNSGLPADPDMFISGTVIFNFRYLLTPGYVDKVCSFIRKINPLVQNNRIQWQNLSQKYDDWMAAHANPADNYMLMCADLPSNLGVNEMDISELKVYPNPSTGEINIQSNKADNYVFFDPMGNVVFECSILEGVSTIQLPLVNGCYLIRAKNSPNSVAFRLVIAN